MPFHFITGKTAKLPGDLALPALPKKRNKFRNVPTVVDGIRFASKAEARRYGELKLLEKAGKIADLELQPRFLLIAGVVYVGDFAYREDGKRVVEDVKGIIAQHSAIKMKLFRHLYPDIELRIVK